MASPKEGGGTKIFGEHEKTYKMNLEGFQWNEDWLHKSPYYIIAKSLEFHQLMNL